MPSRSRRIWLSNACSSLTSAMAASRSRAGAPTLSMTMDLLRFSSSNWRSIVYELMFDSVRPQEGWQMIGDTTTTPFASSEARGANRDGRDSMGEGWGSRGGLRWCVSAPCQVSPARRVANPIKLRPYFVRQRSKNRAKQCKWLKGKSAAQSIFPLAGESLGFSSHG